MSVPQTKSELLSAIDKNFDKLIGYLHAIPAELTADDQIHMLGLQDRPHRLAVGRPGRPISRFIQIGGNQLANVAIVIDNQNMVNMFHCRLR